MAVGAARTEQWLQGSGEETPGDALGSSRASGPQWLRLYNGPALSWRRRAGLARVNGLLPVNVQRRAGSAGTPALVLAPGPGPAAPVGAGRAGWGPGRASLLQAPQPPSALGPAGVRSHEGAILATPTFRARLPKSELRAAHPSRTQGGRERRLRNPAGGDAVGSLLAPRRRRRRLLVRP